MPSHTPMLTIQSARELIRERSFTQATRHRVGVELEWFTTPSSDPPGIPRLEQLLGGVELPDGSKITFEPGGQVELSSLPHVDVAHACDAIASDADLTRRILTRAGHPTFAAGYDPQRSHELRTDAPRYVAMRAYFDRYGPAGGRMMCASGAIHVNVDAGDDAEGRRRWHVAHLAGPMLIAAFANSPVTEAGITGYKSSRIRAWHELDPSRTRPVEAGDDMVSDWTSYALEARVMFIRLDGRYEPIDDGMTFAEWIANGHPLGSPTDDDLAYHLTTLFPPVRPHGHLELRMIDMLDEPWWRAAVALTTAIVCDPPTQDVAALACADVADRWDLAAKCALEDPPLRAAATTCFEAALGALGRVGCDPATVRAANDYVERYTSRGLTPADEILAGLHAEIPSRRRYDRPAV